MNGISSGREQVREYVHLEVKEAVHGHEWRRSIVVDFRLRGPMIL